MSISGTVPIYDFSTSRIEAQTVASVTGAAGSAGLATASTSNETHQEFLRRAIAAVTVSGTADAAGQIITSGELSGVLHLQQELAFRIADVEHTGESQANRLSAAQAVLAAASGASHVGETAFGS